MHQHQPSLLVQILARRLAVPVRLVEVGMQPEAGTVLVAPPGVHVIVNAQGRLELWDGPPVNHVRPSADLPFSSAAAVIVQAPENCDFPGMVEATTRLVEPDLVLPVDRIAAAFERLAAEAVA